MKLSSRYNSLKKTTKISFLLVADKLKANECFMSSMTVAYLCLERACNLGTRLLIGTSHCRIPIIKHIASYTVNTLISLVIKMPFLEKMGDLSQEYSNGKLHTCLLLSNKKHIMIKHKNAFSALLMHQTVLVNNVIKIHVLILKEQNNSFLLFEGFLGDYVKKMSCVSTGIIVVQFSDYDYCNIYVNPDEWKRLSDYLLYMFGAAEKEANCVLNKSFSEHLIHVTMV